MDKQLNPGFLHLIGNVAQKVDHTDLKEAFERHCRCDWGEVSRDDWLANDWSVEHGGRVQSAYTDRNGTEFWIWTDDQATTMILLPELF